MNEDFLFGLGVGAAATFMLIASFIVPALDATYKLIEGGDVASYYGVPKPAPLNLNINDYAGGE